MKRKTNASKLLRKLSVSLLIVLLLPSYIKATTPENNVRDIPYPMFGITVDDSWRGSEMLDKITDAIKAMSVKPTVRIVMSNSISSKEYQDIFKAIHDVAYVLAQPVDSYYMKGYKTVNEYLNRFVDSYTHLAEYTDMWEIANEINGEGWLGDDRQFNADKMYAAYNYIHNKGGKTVLVSYEVAPGDQEMSMLDWLKQYVPSDMKTNLDYLLVSYYEDDHNNYQPDWSFMFKELQTIFPTSKLGIGECGNTARNRTEASKLNMIRHYYSMPKYVDNYIGGYFWWTWVQDCVPHENNLVWKEIDTYMLKQNERK